MIKRYVYAITLSLVLLGLAVPFVMRHNNGDWENSYLPAAQHMRAGESIYQDGYTYPPFMAWVAVPFTHWPRTTGRVVLYAANVIAILTILVVAWRLTGGRRLDGAPPVSIREHWIAGLGLLTGIYYLLDGLSNQQTDLVVVAVLMAGCALVVRGRDLAAGAMIGLAAAMKTTPLLWVPYLAWRGRGRAAMLVVVVAVGVNVLPDLTHPPADGGSRLGQWVALNVAPLTQAGHLPVMGFTGPNFNHSVAGVTTRWLIFERVWKDGDFTIAYRSTPARLVTLRVIVYATMALLVIVVVAVVRRLPRGRSPAGEFALVLLLMPLLSPVSSKPHFAVLLLPGFFLARSAVERTERWPRVLLAAAIAAGLVSNKDLVGGFVYDNVIWWGSVLWNTIFVLAGCVVVLWRSTERERIDGCARLRGGRAGRNNRTARQEPNADQAD